LLIIQQLTSLHVLAYFRKLLEIYQSTFDTKIARSTGRKCIYLLVNLNLFHFGTAQNDQGKGLTISAWQCWHVLRISMDLQGVSISIPFWYSSE
jgi:hypothetical protein